MSDKKPFNVWGPPRPPAPGTSPLEDTRPLTEEEIKAAFEEARKKCEERKRKSHEAPKVASGTCVVCKGEVKGEYKMRYPSGPIYGPRGRRGAWSFEGFHCVKCGLAYKFAPPKLESTPT